MNTFNMQQSEIISVINNSSSKEDIRIISMPEIYSQRRRQTRGVAVFFILVFCLLNFIAGEVKGDIYDCKSRVRNEWVTFCANDGSRRGKRGALRPLRPDSIEKSSNPRFRPPVSEMQKLFDRDSGVGE